MKHFRFGVGFLFVLIALILSACTASHHTSAPDRSGNTDIADHSFTDNSIATSDSGDDPTATSGVSDDPAATTGEADGDSAATEGKSDNTASKPDNGKDSKNDSKSDSKTTSNANAHIHTFVGTTCTQSGKCACGATQAALGHDFAAATCTAPSTCKRCKTTKGSALGHSYSSGKCTKCGDTHGPLTPAEAKLFKNKLSDEENAQALAVARKLAKQIEKEYPNGSDFDKISMAAVLVSQEYQKGVHVESGIYYSTAYGVFVKRESSCAGCCRALGLVLSCMGYKWTHVNENQYQHQWVTVTVNGETIWADGQVGWAGYGKHPMES